MEQKQSKDFQDLQEDFEKKEVNNTSSEYKLTKGHIIFFASIDIAIIIAIITYYYNSIISKNLFIIALIAGFLWFVLLFKAYRSK